MIAPYPIADLPGADLIGPGLLDYAAGRVTKGSLMVRIGRPRFAAAGLLKDVSEPLPLERDAEHVLYELVCRETGRNAYPEYRALLRLLVSFENAADQRHRLHLMARSEPATQPDLNR